MNKNELHSIILKDSITDKPWLCYTYFFYKQLQSQTSALKVAYIFKFLGLKVA